MSGTGNTLLLLLLELTFIFVVVLLLFSQRKSLGDIPFCIMLGMLLVFGEFLGGANLCFNGVDHINFQIAPVVVFVPFMAAILLLYITDGVLAAQRLIIGSLVAMGVFFYLGDLSRLQMRWVSFSIAGNLPLEAWDVILERTRRAMLAVVIGQLLALFIMPVIFQRLRNTGHRLFVCRFGALSVALTVDSLIYEIMTRRQWDTIMEALLPVLVVRVLCGTYLAALMSIYIARIGRESEARYVRPLEILFAFFGGYGRSKLLEANLLEWEGRYRVILENASEMIVVVDKTGKVLDANHAAEKMIALRKLPGQLFNDFLIEEDRALFRESLLRTAESAESSNQIYVRMLPFAKTNGKAEHLTIALTITPMSIGALEAFIIMGRDITEELNLEAEKQRLNEALAHSQRLESLGQLAGGVAHDFNNNIHAILGHADLINMKDRWDDNTRRHLEKIIEIAESSGHLTSQLLGFARKGKYLESDFDLRILLRKTVDLFLPGSTDIEFAVKTPDKPLLIRGDQIQLQQVILNLMINSRDALRSVSDRERQLLVELTEVTDGALPECIVMPPEPVTDQRYVLLSIQDNGCGMDDVTLEKLYEPFFTTKPVGQGTGMGMAMAYGTIHNHHGAIGVVSKVNVGTTIYVLLPEL